MSFKTRIGIKTYVGISSLVFRQKWKTTTNKQLKHNIKLKYREQENNLRNYCHSLHRITRLSQYYINTHTRTQCDVYTKISTNQKQDFNNPIPAGYLYDTRWKNNDHVAIP